MDPEGSEIEIESFVDNVEHGLNIDDDDEPDSDDSDNSGDIDVEVDVDIEVSPESKNIVSLMKERLERKKSRLPSPSKVCIFKVPNNIKFGNKADYDPKLISIGPYHWGEELLAPMKDMKLRYLKDLLNRNPKRNKVERYMKAVKSRLEEAKQCYRGFDELNIADDVFLEMLLFDGCFLVELFLKQAEYPLILPQKIDIQKLRHDLILMENQIPFFILQVIYDRTKYKIKPGASSSLRERCSLFDLAIFYLNSNKEMEKYEEEKEAPQHLLHLLWKLRCHELRKSKWVSSDDSRRKGTTYLSLCVFCCGIRSILSELIGRFFHKMRGYFSYLLVGFIYIIICSVESSFKLKKYPKSTEDYLDDSLSMVLKIPNKEESHFIHTTMIPNTQDLSNAGMPFRVMHRLCQVIYSDESIYGGQMDIHDNFFTEMENILLLEKNPSTYMYWMRNLVGTTKDVVILKRFGIFNTKFYTDLQIVDFFSKQRPWLKISRNEQIRITNEFKAINQYCRRPHNIRRARLMQDYFTNPAAFVVISFIVLIFFLYGITGVSRRRY